MLFFCSIASVSLYFGFGVCIMSNIDEKVKNNFTIEMRIFENYEKE